MPLAIQALQPFYAGAGLLSRLPALEQRIRDDALVTDYGIVPEVRRDLAQASEAGEALDRFERAVRARRDLIHAGEVSRLHEMLKGRGIRPLPGETPVEDVLGSLLNGEQIVEGGDLVFSSSYFGKIDLNSFNSGLAAFRGGAGQVSLCFGLAVLTGRADYAVMKLPAKLRKIGGPRDQGGRFPVAPVGEVYSSSRRSGGIPERPVAEGDFG